MMRCEKKLSAKKLIHCLPLRHPSQCRPQHEIALARLLAAKPRVSCAFPLSGHVRPTQSHENRRNRRQRILQKRIPVWHRRPQINMRSTRTTKAIRRLYRQMSRHQKRRLPPRQQPGRLKKTRTLLQRRSPQTAPKHHQPTPKPQQTRLVQRIRFVRGDRTRTESPRPPLDSHSCIHRPFCAFMRETFHLSASRRTCSGSSSTARSQTKCFYRYLSTLIA